MKFSDEQLKFAIFQLSKGSSAIAVKPNFLQTYVIWGRQRNKFTLTNFQRACSVSILKGRFTFCCWFLSQDRNFHSKVLWSDAKLWVLDPESNLQNDRIWARSMIKKQEKVQIFFFEFEQIVICSRILKIPHLIFHPAKIRLICHFRQKDSPFKSLIGFG